MAKALPKTKTVASKNKKKNATCEKKSAHLKKPAVSKRCSKDFWPKGTVNAISKLALACLQCALDPNALQIVGPFEDLVMDMKRDIHTALLDGRYERLCA